MKWHELQEWLAGCLRKLMWQCFPQAALHWRNGAQRHQTAFRWGQGMAGFFISAMLVFLIQMFLHQTGWFVSQAALHQELMQGAQSLKLKALKLQSEAAAKTLLRVQKNADLRQLNAQVDHLMAHWPNSAIRMPLLSQLQVLAIQKGLQVIELKALPLPDAHGFEGSRIHLQVKGSERATYAYWQSLDQVFANGIWPNLSWSLQSDGQYLLAAQLHLWWDADDAFTDTGVEVRWLDAFNSKPVTEPVAGQTPLPLSVHVFPGQSHAQMKLVGSGHYGTAPLELSRQTTIPGWALVKSGLQVLPIQSGQYLGSERAKILFANEQGLWGEVGEGPVQKLIAWEASKP